MSETAVFDTRYFNQAYYSSSPRERAWLGRVFVETKHRLVSVVTVHEVYRLALQSEGRDVARLRCSVMERDFNVVPLDGELAVLSAELRHGQGFSLADAAIAATTIRERCAVISDDPHFSKISGLKTRWMS